MSTMLPKVEKFEHIECESLTVKNDNGASIRLSFDEAGYPEVGLSSSDNSHVYQVSLKVSDNGGVLLISRSDGLVCITLSIDDNGVGRVSSGTHNRRFSPSIPGVDV